MKRAVVTGASSGIGLAVVKRLIADDYTVSGLARNFSKANYQHVHFERLVCDLTHFKQIENCVEEILEKGEIDVLINNAGVGIFAPHEELSVEQIDTMVRTNLMAPLIITKMLLRSLKKTSGYVININSIEAFKASPSGGVYGATKAGLRHFGLALFEEVRKSGVKVVNVNPDITQTRFYDKLHFQPAIGKDTYLTPESVAEAVDFVLHQPHGVILSEVTVRPQRFQIEKKKKPSGKA